MTDIPSSVQEGYAPEPYDQLTTQEYLWLLSACQNPENILAPAQDEPDFTMLCQAWNTSPIYQFNDDLELPYNTFPDANGLPLPAQPVLSGTPLSPAMDFNELGFDLVDYGLDNNFSPLVADWDLPPLGWDTPGSLITTPLDFPAQSHAEINTPVSPPSSPGNSPFTPSAPSTPLKTSTPSSPVRNFACPSCPKTFSKQHQLDTHAKRHSRPFTCPVSSCGKPHGAKRDLGRHLWSKHPEYAAAHGVFNEHRQCQVCGKVQRSDNLVRHMASQHGIH